MELSGPPPAPATVGALSQAQRGAIVHGSYQLCLALGRSGRVIGLANHGCLAATIRVPKLATLRPRYREDKPENTGVRGAESTLTAILGRMAMDVRAEVTWDEMMGA